MEKTGRFVEATQAQTRGPDFPPPQGRPIMHIKPGGVNPYSVDERVKAMMYALEESVASMEQGVETWVWVLDFSDYGNRARSPDGLKVAKTCLSLLQARLDTSMN